MMEIHGIFFLLQDLSKKHSDELTEVTKGLKLEISLLKQSHDGSSSRSSVQQLKQEMCMEYTSTLKVRVLWPLKLQDQSYGKVGASEACSLKGNYWDPLPKLLSCVGFS